VGAPQGQLRRHFGLLQATALNMTMIVGAGVFITVPLMLVKLPGPYALLGWIGAGLLILFDGLIWSELGATLPGSGGSYLYLLESYGREKWGRLMAFLFIWQFLISGPLELASGLIAMDTFSQSLHPGWAAFNTIHTWHPVIKWAGLELGLTFSPARLLGFLVGLALIVLSYRNIRILGYLTVTLWLGVLAIIVWVGLEGLFRFDPARAFDFSGLAAETPKEFSNNLGRAMILAMYSYLGYYNICYIGDEVRDPGRTIPRAILLSALLVVLLFVGLHLAMLGVVPWQEVPTEPKELETFSLPAVFMDHIHGQWAVVLVTLLLIWSCLGSVFAGLLGYSRIPYGAARHGHFFAVMGAVSPHHQIPHLSLMLVGGLMLFWSFFDLGDVINALIATRILAQFIAQIVGVMILRRTQPDRPRPFRIFLYPLPCGLALLGWLFLYITAEQLFLTLSLVTLISGVLAYFWWAWARGHWPFAEPRPQ
jgi:basic amino acid/polyamine antiporter, APA family